MQLGSHLSLCNKSRSRQCKALSLICLIISLQVASTSDSPASQTPQVLPQQQQAAAMSGLAPAINTFGEHLFQVLASQAPAGQGGAGTFLSPFSIAQALGMLLNGVEPGGESAAQLQKAVFGGSQLGLDALNAQLKALSAGLVKASDGENLTVSDANSVWVAKRYALQPKYSEALAEYFGARAETITTAQAVNGWVSEATRGKIKEIVDEGTLQMCTCVLINALYFKGLWQSPFKSTDTGPVPFRYLEGRSGDVSMMFQSFKPTDRAVKVTRFQASLAGAAPDASLGSAGFGLGGSAAGAAAVPCIAVQLPYRGGGYAAVVAMPEGNLSATKEGAPLQLESGAPYSAALSGCRAALLAGLGSGNGAGALQWEAPRMQVKLWLPRFEIEYGTSLAKALRQLGVTRPFQGGDITRVAATTEGNPIGDLVVSDVIHKVYVKVAEEGTEAAAATAIFMVGCAMPPPPEPEQLIKFDRPFAFGVVHRPSGVALFLGEVQRPQDWSPPPLPPPRQPPFFFGEGPPAVVAVPGA